MWKNERGSSMLLVLLAIVLFSVLGLAIMGMSLNTAKLTDVRETDVQYIHLAEKELDRLAAEIYAQFDGYLVDDGTNINTMINNKIETIKDNIGAPITAAAIGVVDPCGTTITPTIENTSWTGNDLQIRLKAVVSTDASAPPEICAKINRTLEQTITLSKVPDALKYAVGTEGKLTMNGAPYIIGDIYAGNSLYIAEDAEYIFKNAEKKENTGNNRPILHGGGLDPTNTDEKRKMYSNLFIQNGSNKDGNILRKASGATEWSDFLGAANRYKNKEIKEIEGEVAFSKGKHPTPVPNHSGEVFPIYRGYTPFTTYNWDNDIWNPRWDLGGAAPFHTLNTDPAVLEPGEDYLDIDNLKNGQKYLYQGSGPLNISYTALEGYYGAPKSLTCSDCGTGDTGTWIFVDRQNVSIEGPAPDPVSGICPTEFEINKVHFVIQGNLEITGCLKMNSAIYVNGHPSESWVTEIGDAYLKGIADQALILFSKPPIRITRVNKFEDTSTQLYPGASGNVMRGFFYTEGATAKSIGIDEHGNQVEIKMTESTLYGVGSRLWIKGGFFSKNGLTLNAYRGDVKLSNPSNTDFTFTPDPRQGASRLVVEYDKDSIESHSNANTLPKTDTAYIMVEIGPRQLR